MEATLRKISSVMTIIESEAEIKAAMNFELTVPVEEGGNKLLLVTKGNEMAKTVEQVYQSFRDHRDLSGNVFVLSRRLKGICHRDAWNNITKLTNYDYTQYLSHWLMFATLIDSAEGTHMKLDHPVLAITPKLPNFAVQIWSQSRWLTPTIAGWFKWLED